MTAIAAEGYPLAEQVLCEFKHYSDLNIPQGLLKGTGWLKEFWVRTCKDAARIGKQPLLVARQNRYPTLALLSPGFKLFKDEPPILVSLSLAADFYLFDPATAV